MNLMRFIALLFAFIGILASCTVAVALPVLMLRFWPLLVAALLTLVLFHWFIKRAGVCIVTRP